MYAGIFVSSSAFWADKELVWFIFCLGGSSLGSCWLYGIVCSQPVHGNIGLRFITRRFY